MANPRGSPAQYSAMILLDYMQAPSVGLYFLAATAFGMCVLQKSKPVSHKRRRLAIAIVFALLVGYVAELLYYLSRSFADLQYTAPQHAAIRYLGSVLVWILLSSSIVTSKTFTWHPYFGGFVIQFTFEAITCLLRGFSLPLDDRYSNIPLSISAARAFISLVLLTNSFLVLISITGEEGTYEEEQSLLGAQANRSATANGSAHANGSAGYGSIEQAAPDDSDEDETPAAHEKARWRGEDELGVWHRVSTMTRRLFL
ncbi:hypothetical protein P171DRAFT_437182 [Karstenula rhodostoma CBS 690.94]|uniref:Uncharacterized protein n=1 Tax=Karstenula rhodostoma CBS 690.94 TaxID=1392251 RepID=A0A9P4P4B4_9PLEO|nr:hypothetical protein P171DRAFT_437182 [Karstenula rhodostoma CBS 690.94]